MIYLIGNPTYDRIITSDAEVETIGGTVWYAAQLLVRLMRKVAVVGCGDARIKHLFKKDQVNVRYFSINGPVAHFENDYSSGGRYQYARIRANPKLSTMPPEASEAEALLVGPVLQEVDPAIMAARRKGPLLLDAQGFLRYQTSSNQIVERMEPVAETAIRHCDILKLDAREAQVITSTGHINTALKILYRMGPTIIIITRGSEGAHLYDGTRFIQLSAPKVPAIDSTGAGDVFAAAFLVRYLVCRDPIIAGQFAVAAAALSTCDFGASAVPSQQEIEHLQACHFLHPDTIKIQNHTPPR